MLRLISALLVTWALAWCGWNAWRIWTTPVRYQTISWQTDSRGQTVRGDGFALRRFRDVSAFGILPLLVPVIFTSVALWAVLRRSVAALGISAILMLLFTFVSGFSIGAAYIVPSGILLIAMVVSIVDQARFF